MTMNASNEKKPAAGQLNGTACSLWVKGSAWVMITISAFFSAVGILTVFFMYYGGYFSESKAFVDEWLTRYVLSNNSIFSDYAGRLAFIQRCSDYVYGHSGAVVACTAAALLITLAIFVYLMWSAGRHRDTAGYTLSFIDRIPFDLYLFCAGLAAFLAAYLVSGFDYAYYSHMMLFLILFSLAAAVVFDLLLLSVTTAAARVKCGGLWKNTIIYFALRLAWIILKWLWRGVAAIARGVCRLFGMLPVVWTYALGFIAYAFFSTIFFASFALYNGGITFLLWLIIEFAAFALVCATSWQFKRILHASGKLAAGDLTEKADTSHMYHAFKKLADDLNSVGDGMAAAVEERTRSERLRTELITNVSHDIKTPLTSIINYTDLLGHEELSETAAGYVEVLSRQSARLKKLTDDIVEASKASSGSVRTELAPTDLRELIEQCAAEYSERFENAALTPVVTLPEDPLIITADGRLLWRVFDNLLDNACKYSMSGTRIYIAAEKKNGEVRAAIRNISREPLDITEEELMERFVRGDRSRNTDGSGLGLSIARSLTELLGGSLGISIDGDLFRASLSFPALSSRQGDFNTKA